MSASSDLIQLMRCIPYPVVVVTLATADTIRGVTIGSFTSLSLDPPLISFNLDRSSRAHELMQQAHALSVHVPGDGMEELCNRFARPDQRDRDQFKGVQYRLSEQGVPLLGGVLARIDCTPEHRFVGGDHSLIVGRVREVVQFDTRPPLLYMDGTYRHLRDSEYSD